MYLALIITIQALLTLSLAYSIVRPDNRVWPPPQRNSWQFWFTWVGTSISVLGFLTVGAFNWGEANNSLFMRLGTGIPLLVGGTAFALWGVRTLSTHASLGLGNQMIEKGPYLYSRNPQYVGDILAIIGWSLLADSSASTMAGLGAVSWFILAPYAEEPWLRTLFGDEYDRYYRMVPRFLGPRHG